ncbi:transcriptional regulator, partial [Yersinia pestis]
MQLNKFTDYALRILMYVAQPRDLPYTIAELAERLQVSQNHAMKIVHFMA